MTTESERDKKPDPHAASKAEGKHAGVDPGVAGLVARVARIQLDLAELMNALLAHQAGSGNLSLGDESTSKGKH